MMADIRNKSISKFIAGSSFSKPESNFTALSFGTDPFLPIVAATKKRKELPMFVLAAVIWLPLILAASGVDLLVENINPYELSNMGVVIRSRKSPSRFLGSLDSSMHQTGFLVAEICPTRL